MAKRGIKIRDVEPDSPARRAGLSVGDEILALNGHAIPDELALRFYLADEEAVEFDIWRQPAGKVRVEVNLADGQGLGIEVEDFRTRTCNNNCLFCFIHQLPANVRQSLKVKDDDYRLSFLHGNYITLTNLSDKELDRIIEHALSPLYVSVHATDPQLRARIMGRTKADDLSGKMRRLIDGGIRIHTQIVLLPQINDGDHLARTVFDLYSYYPGVDSVAIVPLGLSDYGRGTLTPVDASFCRRILGQVAPWQDRFRQVTGRSFAYLADEFYIQGGAPIPEAGTYDDYAQIEDGVGMVRRFLDEFSAHVRRRRKRLSRLRGTLATGKLFFPFLKKCAARFNEKFASDLRVAEVENRFLGKSITVGGLLAGGDFAYALSGRPLGDFVIVPNEAISRTEGVFLDDMTPADLSRRIGVPVLPSGPTMLDFFNLLCSK